MDDTAIARAIHVLAILFWIGGVAMVTTVLLLSIRCFKEHAERAAFFEIVERRFARQARLTTLIAGASGFYMVQRLDLWDRFGSIEYWSVHAMLCVWLLFTLMLFVVEPLLLRHWFNARSKIAPRSTFALIQWLHWVMLGLSLVTVFGAVAGSHGMLLFG
jgi:uncharacterized membrane protein